jgi:CheY-like chemotaxis protein
MLPSLRSDDDPIQPHVLLVEDEVVIRALMAEELRGFGLAVVEAANADEAWSYLHAGGRADLVFSDVTMPGSMNGIELVRRVKAEFPGIKAIITSGNPGPANIAELAVFLPKPYRLEFAAHVALKSLGLPVIP